LFALPILDGSGVQVALMEFSTFFLKGSCLMPDLTTLNVHDLSDRLVAVSITQNEAKVWLTGLDPDSLPKKIDAPDAKDRYMHVREMQHHRGHDSEHSDHSYYEEIAQALVKAPQILLLGHGKGKANSVAKFIRFLQDKHPQTAAKVAGTMDINLQALTDPEILAMSRNWFVQHIKSGI
jgi:hypothetical protein